MSYQSSDRPSDQPLAPEDVTMPPVNDPRSSDTGFLPEDHLVDADAPPVTPWVEGGTEAGVSTTSTSSTSMVGGASASTGGDELAAPAATLPEDFAAASGQQQSDSGQQSGGGGLSAGSTLDSAKNWVSEHPLLAAGAGLMVGVILGMRGGEQRHESHRYDRGPSGYRSYRPPQIEGSYIAGRSMSGGGSSAGVMKLAQQSGLSERLSSMIERTMREANDQARQMLSQRLPAFEDKLHEQERQRQENQTQPKESSGQPAQSASQSSTRSVTVTTTPTSIPIR